MSEAQPSRRLLMPALFTLTGAILLAALGTWQLERKAWKEALIAALAVNRDQPATALPVPESWGQLRRDDSEFRRVRFTATMIAAEQALVYAPSSGARTGPSGPGYFVFARARLTDGGELVVNRGFVPEGRQHEANLSKDAMEPAELVGIMRWPESGSLFTPADQPERNLWLRRDHRAMARAKGWAPVGPFYIEIENPAPAGGLPRPAPLPANLPNNHLGYALIWFGLAAALIVVFLFFAWERRCP